jgi:hypothetical protein
MIKKNMIFIIGIIICSLLYFTIAYEKQERVITLPTLELSDSADFVVEQWNRIEVGYSMDTFYNCRYDYSDDILMITFDSSKRWRSIMQFELNNSEIGVYYANDSKINRKRFVSPFNGTRFIDTFNISIDKKNLYPKEKNLIIDLHYEYKNYLFPLLHKEKWYHKFFPKVGTNEIKHSIKGKCLCKKTNGEINSKSTKEDFVYIEK